MNADVAAELATYRWVGSVTSRWPVKALKYVAELIRQRVDDIPAGARYVGLEHIESKTGRFLPETEAMQSTAESTVSVFEAGDVLFGKLRPYLAKVAVADTNGYCSSEILAYRPYGLTSAFLKYVMLLDGFVNNRQLAIIRVMSSKP